MNKRGSIISLVIFSLFLIVLLFGFTYFLDLKMEGNVVENRIISENVPNNNFENNNIGKISHLFYYSILVTLSILSFVVILLLFNIYRKI